MTHSNIDRLHITQNQRMRLILGVPRGTSTKWMGHELQILPVEHRAKLSRAKQYRKIRENTKHPLDTTINRIQPNMTPPCGTPCLRSMFLLFVLSMTTLARRLCRYDLIHRNIFPAILHFFSFRSRPSVQMVSNAFCRSIHTVSICFLCWNPSSISCARYVV